MQITYSQLMLITFTLCQFVQKYTLLRFQHYTVYGKYWFVFDKLSTVKHFATQNSALLAAIGGHMKLIFN